MIRRLDEVRHLISTGRIRLGMVREQLRAALGEPNAIGGTSRRNKYPCVWKYGDVEFHWPLARSATAAQQDGLDLVVVDDSEDRPDPLILLQRLP